MNRPDTHVGDYGFPMQIVVVDRRRNKPLTQIGTYETKQILFRSPAAVIKVVDATLLNDGSDGKIEYVFEEDDLDEIGTWEYQVFLSGPNGVVHSDIETFEVGDNIEPEEEGS